MSTASKSINQRKTTACTLYIDQNLYWHRAVSLREHGSYTANIVQTCNYTQSSAAFVSINQTLL